MDSRDTVVVTEIFGKPTPENPDGFYQKIVNGEVIEEVSGKITSPYWHGKPPVFLFSPQSSNPTQSSPESVNPDVVHPK